MSSELSSPSSLAYPAWIDDVSLRAIDPCNEAGIVFASLPLPSDNHALAAFRDMPCQVVPIAWYPAEGDDARGKPRQLLMMGIVDGHAPDMLPLRPADKENIAGQVVDEEWKTPAWHTSIVSEKKTGIMMNEINELVLTHDGRTMGIRLGIGMVDGAFHWWEWVQVEQLWAGPICTTIRAAGYIGVTELGEDDLFDSGRYNAGHWLHRHNWLFAEVTAQLFINGLVRITARHVNNRFFDGGRDLEGFVPVVAFNTSHANLPDIALDGTTTDFLLGTPTAGVHLDIERSTDLISPPHPGSLRTREGLVIYQPYKGVEYLLGEEEPSDRWKLEAEERRMWKGMARSVHFDLSFAKNSIRTRRYQPPYGWQGYAGALWPDTTLPAHGPLESRCNEMINERMIKSSPGTKPLCSGRFYQQSATLDGEHAHALMREAQRTGRHELYDAALHHAYAFADVGIDHTDYTQQILGMPKGSISLVLQRSLGMLTAYLETGDPYLLHCAESQADAAYAIDRGNWPRRSFGRDAAYIRSLTRLYDVTGQRFYLHRAGEACRRVAACQRPDGSFTDQGGTYGAHGHLNEIVKPWMNSILSEVLVDYLERAGSDPVVEACLVRTADWLLSTLLEDDDGSYWPYQVAWGKNVNDPTGKYRPDNPPQPHPVGDFQLDYNARTLLWVSRYTGDPQYALAWQDTYRRRSALCIKTGENYRSTYGEVKVPDNFPWHEAHLWGARWIDGQITFAPLLDALDIGRTASVELPNGRTVHVSRTKDGMDVQSIPLPPAK